MKRPSQFLIATQLKYGLGIIVGLSILLTGLILIGLSFITQYNLVSTLEQERSRAVAIEINAYLDDLIQELSYLSRISGLSNLNPEIQTAFLEGLTWHNSAYNTISILNNQGQVISSVSPYGVSIANNQAQTEAFLRTYREKEDFFGSVEFDTVNQEPFVTLAVPIRDKQDEVDGALIATIKLDFLWFIMANTKIGQTGYVYIIDEQQAVIAQKGDVPQDFAPIDISTKPFVQALMPNQAGLLGTYSGLQGVKVLGAIAPIESANWHVIVELPTAEIYRPIVTLLLVTSLALLLSCVLAIGLGIIVARRIVQPLEQLALASSQITTGDFNVQVDIKAKNELGLLADAFNSMVNELKLILFQLETEINERTKAETQVKQHNIFLKKAVQQRTEEILLLTEQLIKQERLAAVGQISGNIAHELRNPLGAIKQSVFFLNRLYQKNELNGDNPKVKKHLNYIDTELTIASTVISNLLNATRLKAPAHQQLNLQAEVEKTKGRTHLDNKVELQFNLNPTPFLVWADPIQLQQVLTNILTNAAQASKVGGLITIKATLLTEGNCKIEIKDQGHGIKPQNLAKVFEPLYTTKSSGTGLGLSISKQIIQNHGGQITLSSQPNQGTTVCILLPCHSAEKNV